MKITRKFTTPDASPFDQITWSRRVSRISNPDGSVVFEMEGIEVPAAWSQLATDIMVSKYFRKAGVPTDGGPRGLRDAGYDHEAKTDGAFGPETSAKQVIHRLAGCWRHWGEQHSFFDSADDAQAFYDELVYMLLHQMAAPNSPQWFNTGLSWAYGITGPAQGHWFCDPATGEVHESEDAYSHPQPHACFIQEVDDDLVNPGGIMDLWTREARLFKYGSGTGTNFSTLRASGEQLSGGGKSSGLMSWLKIGDRAAAAVKSGGTTRRAAKMVCLDMDHPDIKTFINWKVREEVKVAAMVEGLKLLKKTDESIRITCERLGIDLDYDFNGEAYSTISGQNSNNSVRIPDAFFDALDAPAGSDAAKWATTWRTTGEVARTFDARELWNDIGYAAWRCADPGVQFDTTINAWHTCPGAGRINASNPCSEYMFLDNTACNLASLNVLKFYDPATRAFDVEAFEHAVDLWTMVLEISVLMASFPSEKIATLSYRYRTLGLGYANLGALLMQAGVPYDSDEGRAVSALLSAILTGRSYTASAQMAERFGPFPGFAPERDAILRVIRNHRRAALGEPRDSNAYEQLRIRPVPIDHALVCAGTLGISNAQRLSERARQVWDEALILSERHGLRNAQVSVIAPTGTIGLLMDCDTTGVEPDYALVKYKKLAGGGVFKIANASVEPALVALGYSESAISEMMIWLLGTLDLHVPMPDGAEDAQPGESFAQWLMGRGLNEDDLKAITDALPGVFNLGMAFGAWSLGDEALRRLGLDPDEAKSDGSYQVLRALGLSGRQVDQLNRMICGTQTIEGAPHLRDEHLAVFDCASTCGPLGTRLIRAEGHIRMMAAAQPFISGAISKTINLPNDATVEDITACYRLSWELGLKANAIYRDGSKLCQPLNTTSDAQDESADEQAPTATSEVCESTAINAPADAVSEPIAQPPAVVQSAFYPPEQIDPRTGHTPQRHRLPDTRRSITHKFNIGGHEGYLTVGLYQSGQPGELFITMAKEGSTIGGLMDSLGTATSVALQYGVPLASLVKKFTHQRFEPAGMTTNRDIPFAKSLVDYIFRWLGMEFIPGYREANAPRRTAELASEHAMEFGDRAMLEQPPVDPPRPVIEPTKAVRSEVFVSPTGSVVSIRSATLSAAMDAAGDAPPCDVCGTITVRNGTCYRCLNCGNSMGCS